MHTLMPYFQIYALEPQLPQHISLPIILIPKTQLEELENSILLMVV